MFAPDNPGYDLGSKEAVRGHEVRGQSPASRPVTRQPSRVRSPPVIKMGSFHMHWPKEIEVWFKDSGHIQFNPILLEGIVHGECSSHLYFSCSEGEIYLDHSWKSLIMAIYLESGIFYCKYLQGVGSLIVPSCSQHWEIPLVQLWRTSECFWHECAKCPPSKLYLCPTNCAARITNVTWRASAIFLGFQIMLFICFRRLAKSPGLLSNKEQIKRREARGTIAGKFS